jgi:hypothetical protein
MCGYGFHHLAVVENRHRLSGVLSSLDIVRVSADNPSLRSHGPRAATTFSSTDRRAMKPLLVLMVLGLVGYCMVVCAEEPPAAVKQQEPGPAPEGLGRGRARGLWDDPRFIEDRKWFHFLLDNRAKIRRTITRTEKGVDTLTESDDPEVTAGIQAHVAAMHARVKEGRGIHMRDPLFREVFRHADKVSMKITDTEKGARVIETSDDPYVVSLVQAHADVVSAFIENGYLEVQKNHAVPPRSE